IPISTSIGQVRYKQIHFLYRFVLLDRKVIPIIIGIGLYLGRISPKSRIGNGKLYLGGNTGLRRSIYGIVEPADLINGKFVGPNGIYFSVIGKNIEYRLVGRKRLIAYNPASYRGNVFLARGKRCQ